MNYYKEIKGLYEKRWQKLNFVINIIRYIVIFIFMFYFIFFATGLSMYPVFSNNSIILVNRVHEKYTYGDIITIAVNEKISINKRIIGMSGDVVTFCDGRVYLNGVLLDESEYLDYNNIYTRTYCDKSFTVPEGYVFVLGDNRMFSGDSREFGCFPLSSIKGICVGYINF